jgi:dihydrofolate synthase/folylpolyglutamate synthase
MINIEEEYQKTLEYLYGFVDYSLTRNFRNAPGLFDLGRMREFVDRLGAPDRAYPILHVAGTKGKGSVSALCASALQAAGYRVGLYTSPHLEDYAERIQVNQVPIPHADLVALVDEIRPHIEAVPKLTTFEITTALALLYFARCGSTAVVLEVGLGGRLDATNIVTPRLAVITSISYDHMGVLGNTLAEIAGEKAGIVKSGIPLVISPQPEEARLVFERIAAERLAPLVQAERDYAFVRTANSLAGQEFLVWKRQIGQDSPPADAVRLKIPLLGLHQVENAVTAYAALQVAVQNSFSLSEAQIQQGFEQVNWPARFEVLQQAPPLVVDCAHNRDSAQRLRASLQEYFPGKAVTLVFGASEDKDIQGMFDELLPYVNRLLLTRSFHPRAAEPDNLAALAQGYGKPVSQVSEVIDALDDALQHADEETVVLVTGSIFVAAAVRESWRKRQSKS